jgi:hypothetical protein
MLRFHASVVEVFGTLRGNYDPLEPLTVHFDDEDELYIQLQEIPDRWTDPRSARVYVEVNDQGAAGGDCFDLAELGRDQFRIKFTGDRTLAAYGEVVATFELDDESYETLQKALEDIFAGMEEFRVIGRGDSRKSC